MKLLMNGDSVMTNGTNEARTSFNPPLTRSRLLAEALGRMANQVPQPEVTPRARALAQALGEWGMKQNPTAPPAPNFNQPFGPNGEPNPALQDYQGRVRAGGAAQVNAKPNHLLLQARDAIARGANPELVRQRLRERGVDPGGV